MQIITTYLTARFLINYSKVLNSPMKYCIHQFKNKKLVHATVLDNGIMRDITHSLTAFDPFLGGKPQSCCQSWSPQCWNRKRVRKMFSHKGSCSNSRVNVDNSSSISCSSRFQNLLSCSRRWQIRMWLCVKCLLLQSVTEPWYNVYCLNASWWSYFNGWANHKCIRKEAFITEKNT